MQSIPNENEITIPDYWRPKVSECLQSKKMTETARNEIVRTLVNLLFTKFPKPGRQDCVYLARGLILKYHFVRDGMGNGYVSHCSI